jgi:hypothetical protein
MRTMQFRVKLCIAPCRMGYLCTLERNSSLSGVSELMRGIPLTTLHLHPVLCQTVRPISQARPEPRSKRHPPDFRFLWSATHGNSSLFTKEEHVNSPGKAPANPPELSLGCLHSESFPAASDGQSD